MTTDSNHAMPEMAEDFRAQGKLEEAAIAYGHLIRSECRAYELDHLVEIQIRLNEPIKATHTAIMLAAARMTSFPSETDDVLGRSAELPVSSSDLELSLDSLNRLVDAVSTIEAPYLGGGTRASHPRRLQISFQ
jgi:hypothetical protein